MVVYQDAISVAASMLYSVGQGHPSRSAKRVMLSLAVDKGGEDDDSCHVNILKSLSITG